MRGANRAQTGPALSLRSYASAQAGGTPEGLCPFRGHLNRYWKQTLRNVQGGCPSKVSRVPLGMALSEDDFEHLLGQLHTAHVLEVQRLREQVRGFQRASSKERMRSEAEAEDEVRRSFQEEEIRADSPDELEVDSKVWSQGKKRGLKRQKKWRSSSDLQWQGQLRPFLAKCIKRPAVDCTMSFLIFCNALIFAVEAQYRGFEFADAANFRGAPNGQQNLGRRQILRLLRLRGSASGLLD
ncbi:Scn11a [Symbiodinium necroappetens]|uniref:Scn11a protein n=1 Tax=Symbiodinium necroappetens TaxID=1628268 RepID=A0A812Z1K1_9DINO|nr:Scn11a [Symbiodinium necroappetens]